jgi:hypothetical protein
VIPEFNLKCAASRKSARKREHFVEFGLQALLLVTLVVVNLDLAQLQLQVRVTLARVIFLKVQEVCGKQKSCSKVSLKKKKTGVKNAGCSYRRNVEPTQHVDADDVLGGFD